MGVEDIDSVRSSSAMVASTTVGRVLLHEVVSPVSLQNRSIQTWEFFSYAIDYMVNLGGRYGWIPDGHERSITEDEEMKILIHF
jgi:hypothetical protein